ncbi:hypothetical protein SEA_YECEY3_94 [Mycobacterium phage Yecey3]|uniref:Uncharacterized protein n=1 Tax=Mycobacterium phage Yecey3 TaxID=2656617 RepID=A0A649VA11_9CAUD|nr:hypothetical protein KIV58_gp015 [Mycobacterium phage Yecey3]QGJ88845.1 hypothetical protein SEA_YECEY3_94 [Mycobacterium phage Yecey3]
MIPDSNELARMERENEDPAVLAAIDVLSKTLRFSVKDNLEDDWIA